MTDKPVSYHFRPGGRAIVTAEAVWAGPGRFWRPGRVGVEDGVIVYAGPGGTPSETAGVEIIDLGRAVVTPGLIDAHVHLNLDPGDGLGWEDRLIKAVAAGLVGIRDGGDRDCEILSRRAEVEARLAACLCGTALYRPGRYGAFLGRPVQNETEITAAVADLAARGVDQIKVLASGPVSLTEYGRVGPPQFSTAELKHLVKEAGDKGLKVMAHANGPEAVASCLAAGATSIEHGYFMGPDNLESLAESGAAWIPTIVPLAVLAENEARPERRRLAERTIQSQQEQLARASALGVNLVMGTDAGAPGLSLETAVYREIGLWLARRFEPG